MSFEMGPNQTKWVETLETTEKKQGKGYLCMEFQGVKSYCCLGLATELFSQFDSNTNDFGVITHMSDMHSMVAPAAVVRALKLNDEFGAITGVSPLSNDDVNLAEMNDNNKTFKEIAAFIRANPHRVFTESA